MITSDIGVGIISFDRPSYVRRLLASLEWQTDLDGAEFHLFQDGAVNRYSDKVRGSQDRIDEAVRTFGQARIPYRVIHSQSENVGVGINQFEAYEFMTSKYQHIVMLEDDVVLSPYWLRLVRVLFEELSEHPSIFGLSTAFQRQCGIEEIDANLGHVVYGMPHWWCIAFTADRWQRIRPYFLEYYDLIRERDYADIPHADVLALFQHHRWDQPGTSQDGGKDMAVHVAGMRRVTLAVNRGLTIGRHGIHFTPRRFKRMGFEDQVPYIHASDATREAFEWPET